MEYYSIATSMNELQQQTIILINLTKVVSSKRSQMQKSTYTLYDPTYVSMKTDKSNPCN